MIYNTELQHNKYMTVVSTQSNQPASVSNQAVGRYLSTAAATAVTITTGFKPRVVRVINETSGDEEVWMEGITAGHAMKRVAAGTNAAITSNGITVSDNGFVIGLDTDINVISEQLSWEARG